MDKVFEEAVARVQKAEKPPAAVPWKPDEPHPQGLYAFDGADWTPCSPSSSSSSSDEQDIPRLALLAWNIDYMLPHAAARMGAALAHLEGIVTRHLDTTSTGVVVFLQECLRGDLDAIAGHPWVRARFRVTDRDAAHWGNAAYGTTTLVDRRLPLAGAAPFRVHYAASRMQRDVLCADVRLGAAGRVVRVCNTHLESLAPDPPLRPPQLAVVAEQMRGETLHAAVAAGDFNAVQEFDRRLHADHGLRDAYLEVGGQEDSEEGYTWGQQAATALRERFGCSRMDKVYYCGGLKLERFERFGAGVELSDETQRREIVELGFERPWITDHYGVMAEFSVVDQA
ncbi:Endonuclease/exonuclease/phosphatase [Xylariomycetidae sp. FL0641]|nr:Endonuclease/exonuclease/phosphatase [Xylariomycetidae sp. FL0641]